jgi:hypothetical protein
MTLSDSFLSNAAWLFFGGWGAIVAAVSIAAFGRDLLPWRAHSNRSYNSRTAEPSRPTQSSTP